jgi:hypothetical protein
MMMRMIRMMGLSTLEGKRRDGLFILASPLSGLRVGCDALDMGGVVTPKRYLTAVNPFPDRRGPDVIVCGHNSEGEIAIEGECGQIVLSIDQAQKLAFSLLSASNESIQRNRQLIADRQRMPIAHLPPRSSLFRRLLRALDSCTARPEAKP